MSTPARHNEKAYETCVIRSELRETQVPKDRILDELKRHGFGDDAIFAVKLALEEALTNAVKHGNRCDPCKCVTVRYAVSAEEADIMVRDEGAGFQPDAVPDCTSAERLPVPNGRGLLLIRAYMDEVSYQDCGREVRFVKKKHSSNSPCRGEVTPSPQRRTVYFSGHVQGVGFRAMTAHVARRHTVSGYVRNLRDGRVELVVEGLADNLDAFQREVEHALQSHIQQVDASASPATGEFGGFTVR